MMNNMPTANGHGTPCPRNLPQHFNGCSCVAGGGTATATAEVDLDLTGMTALMDAENAANGAYDPPVSGYDDDLDEAALAAENAALILAHVENEARLSDDFALTETEAYEMNRAQVRSVLDRFSASVADGTDNPALRAELATTALAVSTNLRPAYDTLDENGQHAVDRLDLAMKVADQADLSVEWNKAFADLKAAGVEHDANDPIAARYREASNAVNHANRSLDHAIATGRARSTDPVTAAGGMAEALQNALAVGDANIRTYDGKTATEWREQARGGRQRSADSFARSDTGGYLSQWASDTQARRYDACADLAEQGGRAEFRALFDTDGNLVPARQVQTRFGSAWMMLDANGDSTGEFVNPSKAATAAKRNAAMAKKGYAEGTIRTKAVVRMSDGMMPHPYFDRVDRGFDPNVEIVETTDTGPDYD